MVTQKSKPLPVDSQERFGDRVVEDQAPTAARATAEPAQPGPKNVQLKSALVPASPAAAQKLPPMEEKPIESK